MAHQHQQTSVDPNWHLVDPSDLSDSEDDFCVTTSYPGKATSQDVIMPEEGKDSAAQASNFFSDAVANPVHELGAHIKSATELDDANNQTIIMDPSVEDQMPGKTVFVTVGATASFRSLITEVVSPKVVSALAAQGFDSMVVQCGPDFEYFETIRPSDPEVIMSGFSVKSNILEDMRECAPSDGPPKRGTGLIITHAGAGSIMDALKINCKVIAIPNTDLMGNHQLEMAEEFASKGWIIHGQLGKIHEAIEQSATFSRAPYPPRPSPGSERRGLEQITQDVVNGTWHGSSRKDAAAETTSSTNPGTTFVGTLTEYLRGPLRYIWSSLSADDVGPDYDDDAHNGEPGVDSDEESDEGVDSDAEKSTSPAGNKPKLKRVLFDNGDGTSTVTYVPAPEYGPGLLSQLFARASQDDGKGTQDAGKTTQDAGKTTQDAGRATQDEEHESSDVFDRLFGRVDHDDGYEETDPEVLRRQRAWQNVDDRVDSLSRMFIG